MVVGDDDVQAEGPALLHFANRTNAAVDRHDHRRTIVPEPCQGLGVQTVAFLKPIGDVPGGHETRLLKPLEQQYGGGHTIGIVVAIDHHPLSQLMGLPQALHRAVHVQQVEGIRGCCVTAAKEGLRLSRVLHAPVRQQAAVQGRESRHGEIREELAISPALGRPHTLSAG